MVSTYPAVVTLRYGRGASLYSLLQLHKEQEKSRIVGKGRRSLKDVNNGKEERELKEERKERKGPEEKLKEERGGVELEST